MANYLNKEGLTIVLKNLKKYIDEQNTSYFNKLAPNLTWTAGTTTAGPTGTLTVAEGKSAQVAAIPKGTSTSYGVVIVDSTVTETSDNPVSSAAVHSAIQGLTGDVSGKSDTGHTHKIVLNGATTAISADNATSYAPSIYAPTTSGNATTVLVSNGAGQAPTWTPQSSLSTHTEQGLTFRGDVQGASQNVTFDGATAYTVTYNTVGAAAASHTHAMSDLTGVLDTSKGGTGLNAFTKGDILYASDASTLSKLPIGTEGQVLKVDAAGVPSWAADTDTDTITKISYIETGTPSISTTAASGTITLGSAASKLVDTSISQSNKDSVSLPTTKAVYDYVGNSVANLASALKIKGVVDGTHALPSSGQTQGDVYVVKAAGTYAGQACETGDFIIWDGNAWQILTAENQVTNGDATLTTGAKQTIATVDGVDITANISISKEAGTDTLEWNNSVTLATIEGLAIKAKLPANPNTDIHVKTTANTNGTSKLYITGSQSNTSSDGEELYKGTAYMLGNGTMYATVAYTGDAYVDGVKVSVEGHKHASSDITDTIPVSKGGTGATTLTGVVYGTGTSALQGAATNTANKVLISTSTNGTPKWSDAGIGGASQIMYFNASGVLTAGDTIGALATGAKTDTSSTESIAGAFVGAGFTGSELVL
jgi:hypothetical protein